MTRDRIFIMFTFIIAVIGLVVGSVSLSRKNDDIFIWEEGDNSVNSLSYGFSITGDNSLECRGMQNTHVFLSDTQKTSCSGGDICPNQKTTEWTSCIQEHYNNCAGINSSNFNKGLITVRGPNGEPMSSYCSNY